MKLAVGRMAHVQINAKQCVEALLMGKDDAQIGAPVWRAVALRSVEQNFATPMELSADLACVHEPYGCMREIVMLPVPPESYSFFGPLPGAVETISGVAPEPHDSIPFFKQEATPGADLNPSAPRLMQDVVRYGWRCACGATEVALYESMSAALAFGGLHRCVDGKRRTWSVTFNSKEI